MTSSASKQRRSPQQDRSKQKVERILTTAQHILETEGPNALHMNRIARDIGVSIGTIYEYFPDKTAVVNALIDRAALDEADIVMARMSRGSGSAQESYRVMVATVFEMYRRHRALVVALRALTAEAWDIGARPTERMILDALEQQMKRRFADCPSENPRRIAFVVFHAIESLVARMLDHRDPDWSDDECIDEITRLVLRYLQVPER